MEFSEFKDAVQEQFNTMTGGELFYVQVDRNTLSNLYLSSFPKGHNQIFRVRTEYDCSCCRHFIRDLGHIVAIVDGELKSIWDIDVGGVFQVVADALSRKVKSTPISGVYRYYQKKVGTDKNHGDHDGTIETWSHFYQELPSQYVMPKKDIATYKGVKRTNKEVLHASLEDISLEAAEIVLDLISQNSIYRGKEFKNIVIKFIELKREYIEITVKSRYVWFRSVELGEASRIKNTVIGTLLCDLSQGVDLEDAVKMYESKVAPTNYKRSSALITQSMIKNAEDKVIQLGLEDSLLRRYAITEDVSINNVLFADRSAKKVMGGVFGDLKPTKGDKLPSLDKVEEIEIKSFIDDVLPRIDKLEVMIENRHESNLMSLISPVHKENNFLFKWNNEFSWTYNGEVTDSIKERVKRAGGDVTGDLRLSLSWFNYDDLDIHMREPLPHGSYISYSRKISIATGGSLDVDMNVQSNGSRNAVENITYPNKANMLEGRYGVLVHNFTKRENIDVGFEIEMEYEKKITKFVYEKSVEGKVDVVEFDYSHADGIKIIQSLPTATQTKEIWNINTQKWNKVNMMMLSPNHWDDNRSGNEHWFFILDQCKNPEKARGFYNEFLCNDLIEHRKVFEVLGNKMKADYSDNQLSGIGFSSTKKDSVLCKVSGSFNRVLKINF